MLQITNDTSGSQYRDLVAIWGPKATSPYPQHYVVEREGWGPDKIVKADQDVTIQFS